MPSVVEALVVDNCDPEGMSRVKVKFPTLPDMPESWWARLSMPMAGKDRGWMTIPEVGDEVLVAFMHGDVQQAVVVGSLYNGVDRPPYANEDGQDNLRVFQTRSGHRVTFDDTAGAENIDIVTHNEKIRVIWDPVAKVLSITADAEIRVEAKGDVKIKTPSCLIDAGSSIGIRAGGAMSVQAGAVVGLVGGSQAHLQSADVVIGG
jgi:phage baseplate assembly protein gpV